MVQVGQVHARDVRARESPLHNALLNNHGVQGSSQELVRLQRKVGRVEDSVLAAAELAYHAGVTQGGGELAKVFVPLEIVLFLPHGDAVDAHRKYA